jgi:hypothetical protein
MTMSTPKQTWAVVWHGKRQYSIDQVSVEPNGVHYVNQEAYWYKTIEDARVDFPQAAAKAKQEGYSFPIELLPDTYTYSTGVMKKIA